jgi:hypothetical protein
MRAAYVTAIVALILFALDRIIPKKPETFILATPEVSSIAINAINSTMQAMDATQQAIQTQIASFTTPPPPAPSFAVLVGIKTINLTIEAVLGAGNVKSEVVVISYRAEDDAALPLESWSLHDEDGNSFVFPRLILHRNGAVQVHSAAGVNTVVDLFWGLSQPVWQSGENALLYDPEGKLRAVFRVP